MKLEDIGFYTLSNARCENLTDTSPMMRCEMILTDRCNFSCPYCRGLNYKGDMPTSLVIQTLLEWTKHKLHAVRFSGGEPLAWSGDLEYVVRYARDLGVPHIAISSNGSYPLERYLALIDNGVNDFSISLDACCSSFGDKMAGVNCKWKTVTNNIREIAQRVYTTVGIVLTETNIDQLVDIVKFAHDLGVADIRIISAAQFNQLLDVAIPDNILNAHPILRYRVNNILNGRNVRGIEEYDSHRCYLAIDDSVVCGKYHFPCVIYMREHGNPIGEIGPNMREDRILWSKTHDTQTDPICQKNCLDVCIDHNNYCGCCRREQ